VSQLDSNNIYTISLQDGCPFLPLTFITIDLSAKEEHTKCASARKGVACQSYTPYSHMACPVSARIAIFPFGISPGSFLPTPIGPPTIFHTEYSCASVPKLLRHHLQRRTAPPPASVPKKSIGFRVMVMGKSTRREGCSGSDRFMKKHSIPLTVQDCVLLQCS
jgi:hypothetical protein